MATQPAMCRHDLNNIEGKDLHVLFDSETSKNDIDALSNTLNIKTKKWMHQGDTYQIIRYDKDMLSKDRYGTVGQLRSVIAKDGKICCFAPPKSIDYADFKNVVNPTTVTAQDYIEGTMINVFHTGKEWELSTRSSVGANVGFYAKEDGKPTTTFRKMFLETLLHAEKMSGDSQDLLTTLDNFPKTYTFSFVLQHPDNRIVVPFIQPFIWLVKVYDIQDNVVSEVSLMDVFEKLPKYVCYPRMVSPDYNTLEQCFRDGTDTDYKCVGAMLSGCDSAGRVWRTKIRNPNYEEVRRLRGNQPKLQYRYLMLRQSQKVTDYLKYYPEHKDLFNSYRKMIHDFTKNLHSNYIACYVKKQAPLNQFSPQYRTHMFKLHEHYLSNLAPFKQIINKYQVIEYVNKLHPSLLMHSCNYNYKQAKTQMAAANSIAAMMMDSDEAECEDVEM